MGVKIMGIDTSHWQGEVNWAAVKASGRVFAYLKATEGSSYTDPTYALNRARGLSHGMMIGSYHFYRYEEDWAEQAHHFVTVLDALQPGELPPAIDLEDRVGIKAIGTAAGARKTLAFIEAVGERLDRTVVVYADRDFVQNYLQLPEFGLSPLWLAAYKASEPTCPAPWKKLSFWQSSQAGNCPGVEGDCDLDLYLGGDLASLEKMAGK